MNGLSHERNGSPFLTVEAVAERYHWSVRAVHGRTRVDGIPFLRRKGMRHLLFRVAHLDAWDAGCELETVILPDGSKLVRPIESEANTP